MTNLEIDDKLADAMHIKVHVTGAKDLNRFRVFHPTTRIEDAWEVAERFGLTSLIKSPEGRWLAAYGSETARDQLVPLAICKGALKVIENQEGSKSDE